MLNPYDAPPPPFRSARGLALATTVLLGIIAALSAISAVAIAFQAQLASELASDPNNLGNAIAVIVLALPTMIASLATFACWIVYLVWVHAAYRNLPAIGVKFPSMTPGWAVGWWFIPFASLWMPYKILRELWLKTGGDDETYAQRGGAALVGWWWAMYLLRGVGAIVLLGVAAVSRLDPEGAGREGAVVVQAIGGGIDVAAAVLALLVVRGVNARQEKAAIEIATLEAHRLEPTRQTGYRAMPLPEA